MIFQHIYLRTRRLPRIIVMHWPMDLFAALLTLKLNALGSQECSGMSKRTSNSAWPRPSARL